MTARIPVCNDSCSFDKGTPFERKGRKTTGLRGNLWQRGCQIDLVARHPVGRHVSRGIRLAISTYDPAGSAVLLPGIKHRISSLFDFGATNVSKPESPSALKPISPAQNAGMFKRILVGSMIEKPSSLLVRNAKLLVNILSLRAYLK